MKTTPWNLFDQLLDAKVDRLLIDGPPGLGKSYTPWAWAQANGWEFISTTITDQTPMSELRGHFILKGHDFVWHDGTIARAWRTSQTGKGVVLELNEINEAGADAEVFLHNALDDPEFARLDLPTAETLRPRADRLIIVATMNARPEHLREALRDRFPVRIHVNTPHPAALAKISDKGLRAVATEWCAEGYPGRLSIRPFIAYEKLALSIPQELAAEAIFGDQANDLLVALAASKVAKKR